MLSTCYRLTQQVGTMIRVQSHCRGWLFDVGSDLFPQGLVSSRVPFGISNVGKHDHVCRKPSEAKLLEMLEAWRTVINCNTLDLSKMGNQVCLRSLSAGLGFSWQFLPIIAFSLEELPWFTTGFAAVVSEYGRTLRENIRPECFSVKRDRLEWFSL